MIGRARLLGLTLSFLLALGEATQPVIVTTPMNTIVDEGQSFNLTCVATGNPQPTIQWRKDSAQLGDPFPPGLELVNNSLSFSAAQPSHAGTYTCQASNEDGMDEASATVEVTYGPEYIGIFISEHEVMNGSTVVLDCVILGHPPPNITWYHNGVLVDEERTLQYDNGTLVLMSVLLSDSGTYRCTGNSSNGDTASPSGVMLLVYFPTAITMNPIHTLSIPLGEEREITCKGIGYPPLNFTWYRQRDDGEAEVILQEPERVETTSTLHFLNAQRGDAGLYFCQVSNRFGAANSTHSVVQIIAPPPAPNSSSPGVKTSYTITVRWSSLEVYPPIISYLVEHRLEFHTNWTETAPPDPLATTFTLTNLLPHAPYLVRVRAHNPVGHGNYSEPLLIQTDPGVPLTGNTVMDYSVVDVSSRSLTVQWSVLEAIAQTSYNYTNVTLLHPDGEVTEVNTTDSSVELTDLAPATPYEVYATLVFVGGGSGPSRRVARATMEDAPDSPPENVTITDVTSTSLTLTWTPPSQPNGNITNYTIYYQPEDGSSEIKQMVLGDILVAMVTDLRPFTTYNLNVTASTSVGEGPPGMVSGRTSEAAPRPPTIVELFALDSTSIWLSWQLTEDHFPGKPADFTITSSATEGGEGGEQTVAFNVSSAIISDLVPYRTYSVCVAAATQGGGQGNFSCNSTATFGAIPDAVVVLLSLSPPCPVRGTLMVEWSSPDELQLYGPVEDVTFELSNKPSASVEPPGTATTDGFVTSYNLTGLEDFTNYTVQVAVRNRNGTGMMSDPMTGVTCDALAPPPTGLSVYVLSSTAVRLSWQPVDAAAVNGTLLNYTIEVTSTDSEDQLLSTSPSSSTYTVESLQPYTNYSVRMASETRGGQGNFGTAIDIRTLSAVPSLVLTVVSLEPGCPPSLIVSWEEPDERLLNGPHEDSHYSVMWKEEGGEGEDLRVPFSTDTTFYKITGLRPKTTYTVTVAVTNSNGTGNSSTPLTNTTNDSGDAPSNLDIEENRTSLVVSWSPPPRPLPYRVSYSSAAGVAVNISTNESNITIQDLTPFTTYTVTVRPIVCGDGPASNKTVTTLEAPPGPPEVTVVTVSATSVAVDWTEPEMANGEITVYKVDCSNGSGVLSISSSGDSFLECLGLSPDMALTVAVWAVNGAGGGETAHVNTSTACDVAAPKVVVEGDEVTVLRGGKCPSEAYVLIVVQQLRGAGLPPSLPLSLYTIGQLKALTERYAQQQQQKRRRRRREEEEDVYIAGNLTSAGAISFVLGDGRETGGYKNFPLKSGQRYTVAVFGTSRDPDDPVVFAAVPDPFVAPEKEGSSSSAFPLIPVAAGGGGVVLLVAVLCACVIMLACCRCRRHRQYSPSNKLNTPSHSFERTSSVRISGRRGNKPTDPVEEYRTNYRTEALEAHPPIPINGFVNKLLVMRTNDNQLFLEEFGSIEMTPQQPCSVAELPANRSKNRYNNILTYDHSRVKLSHGRGHSDYINASHCSGFMKVQGFVATQGPLPDTVADMWRMVWEQNSRTLVMLTNTQERGKTKCEVYWPREVGSSTVYGPVEVTLSDFTQLADYTVRSFTLHKVGSGKEVREVRQFHFTSWPDHGVPQYATAMLSMVRRVRAYHTGDSPMMVHCSAGVGRTGTFIVIYSMLERMKASKETVDIYGHVSLLRTQRNYMVQTEDQYFFIYEAVAEAIVCGDTEVSLEKLSEYVEDLQLADEEQPENLNIELEFKRLAVDKSDPFRFSSANKDVNKSKNRYVNVLPYENTRVTLQYQRAQEGSDYINANFIDGYHYRNMFIATQGPLQNTLADFWRMVWECNVPVIVMLTKCHEKGTERSAQYWPKDMGSKVSYGNYSVEMTVERKSEHYTYRDLQLSDSQTGRKRQVRHFHFLAWPEVGVPSSSRVVVDFLREVQKNFATLNTKTPITVHCSNGIGRSGVFIALYIILERMVAEGLVDVFQTIKNLRIQRPAMVQTLEQYQFCYSAALDYLEASDLINQLRSSTRSDTRLSRTASNTSELRSSRRSRSPARSDSVRSATKRSSRNLELSQVGNGVSTVYGGSEATSTFGTSQHLHPATAGSTADSSPSQSTLQGADGSGTPVPSLTPLPLSASPAPFPRHLQANPHLAHLDTSGGAGGGSQSPLSSMQGSSPYLSAQGSAPQLHSAATSSNSHPSLSQGDGHSPYPVFQTNTLPAYHSHRGAVGSQHGASHTQWGMAGASASQGSLTGHTGPAHGGYPTSTFGVSRGAGQHASEDSLDHKMAAMTLNLNNSNNNVVDVYVET